MIPASELRIGNWFLGGWRDANQPMQVDADHLSIWFGNYSAQFPEPNPIPLTREILIACGFEKIALPGHPTRFVLKTNESFYLSAGIGFYAPNVMPEIKYLHQLQNLYFALTNTELTYTP